MLEVLFTIASAINTISKFGNIEEIREKRKKIEKKYNQLSDKEQHKVIMRKFNLSM